MSGHPFPTARSGKVMKMKSTAILAVAALGILAGCASPIAQRAQRADGLLDFLAGNPGETGIAVEKISSGGGRIATAQERAYSRGVFVSGRVERQSAGNPPPWSHVDGLVLNRRGKVIENATVNYLPRDIPHGQRGGFPQSHFTARLKALPPAGATVKVAFHTASRADCHLPHET